MSALGRAPEAVAAFHQAIAALEPRAARDRKARLDLASATGALGSALAQQGKFEEAAEQLRRCAAIEKAELGPDAVEYARTLHDLANQELDLDHVDDAVRDYQQARAVFMKVFGPEHELVIESDLALANVARARRQPQEARRLLEQLRARLPDNPDVVGRVEAELGGACRDLDDGKHAIMHYRNALAAYAKVGLTGAGIANVHSDLALVLANDGQNAEARREATAALVEYDRVNAEPRMRINAWVVLGELEHDAGHNAEGIAIERQILAALGGKDSEDARAVRKVAEESLAAWSK
jgi:tetratricopeptide (TPR) repeat protein